LNSYHTIETIENILYKDKASKFIGFAYSVKEEDDIKEKLIYLKNLHPKATHHCYAYRLGFDKNNFRCNDDGEPNGTAGKPILGQIDSNNLTNCLIVVVRYFGGTKLGVSGLIDAYKECTKLTVASTIITTEKISDYFELKCSYENINKIYQIVHQVQAIIVEQILNNESSFLIAVDLENKNIFVTKLVDERIKFKFLERK
jgi:uncharacterized YigZ family protein